MPICQYVFYFCRFHILSDFDEGKRSCRRKLERHNNRRRRKPNDSKEDVEKESQVIILADDLSGDDDTGKGTTIILQYSTVTFLHTTLYFFHLRKLYYSTSLVKAHNVNLAILKNKIFLGLNI